MTLFSVDFYECINERLALELCNYYVLQFEERKKAMIVCVHCTVLARWRGGSESTEVRVQTNGSHNIVDNKKQLYYSSDKESLNMFSEN